MSLLKRFKYKTSAPPDLKEYVGMEINISDTDLNKYREQEISVPESSGPIVIESIVGNVNTVTAFEINGTHLINMLLFFKIINNDKSITDEQIKAFQEIEYEVVKAPVSQKNETRR